MLTKKSVILPSLCILILLICTTATAGVRIAILSFELNDMTSLPNTQAEKTRTASIKPMLEFAMQQRGDYEIINITLAAQNSENAGFGYLFRFNDIAARLGKKFDAEWIVVGQHRKPSFLFSYLITHIVSVRTGQLVARFDIEMKGNHKKVTQRSVRKLSKEIDKVLVKFQQGD